MKIQEAKNKLISVINGVENADSYFSGLINKSEFIAQILFEIIKKQYYSELPTTSLRQYAIKSKQKYSGLDSEYEMIKRRHKMASLERDKLYQSIGLTLHKNDMSNIDTRLEGYHYNSLQVRQMQNYGLLKLFPLFQKDKCLIAKR